MSHKETINFDEFKAWLTGFIHGKGGAVPNINDWKEIKKQIDKVVPEVITVPIQTTYPPYTSPGIPQNPITTPNWVYTTSTGTDVGITSTANVTQMDLFEGSYGTSAMPSNDSIENTAFEDLAAIAETLGVSYPQPPEQHKNEFDKFSDEVFNKMFTCSFEKGDNK